MRGRQKRRERGEWNLLEWRRKPGEGTESLSPQPPGEGGARVVVVVGGGTRWRALRAYHVTMERWSDGNWRIVGVVGTGGVKDCQERRHWDDSFQMYGGTPAVVYYWESEFDEGADSIKKQLASSSYANQYGRDTNYNVFVNDAFCYLALFIHTNPCKKCQTKLLKLLFPCCREQMRPNIEEKRERPNVRNIAWLLQWKVRVRYVLVRAVKKTLMSEVNTISLRERRK